MDLPRRPLVRMPLGRAPRVMSRRTVRRVSLASGGPKVPRPPPASSQAVSAVMRANRAKGTAPELALERALKTSGLSHFQRSPSGLPGRPDLAFPKRKVAVFVHGCFWHRCPRHARSLPKANREYWMLKFGLNRRRDLRKIRELRKLGWRVMVFWECQVKERPATSVARVKRELARKRITWPPRHDLILKML